MGKAKIGLYIALYLLVFAIYWQVKGHHFILVDDHIHITENTLVHPPSVAKLKTLWTQPTEGLYIPVTYTAWAGLVQLNYWLYGDGVLKPVVFHLVNLFFHIANTCLVFSVLGVLRFRPLAQFAGALLFGVHLAQVESVAWVSGLKDLLSTFFALLCIRGFLKGRSFSSTIFFALAILSKPAAIAAIPICFGVSRLMDWEPARVTAKRLWVWLILAFPIFWITRAAQGEQTMKFVTPLWQRPFVAADAAVFYLGKALAPLYSAADYSRTPERVLGAPWGYVAWMVLALVFLLIRKERHWRILLITFLLSLSPVLGLVPFSYQFFSTVADRYLYLPLFVVAIATAFLYEQSTRRTRRMLFIVIAAVALITAQQVKTWKDDKTLFTHLLKVNPRSLLGTNNLGTLYENENDLDSAELYYRRALAINPSAYPAMYNLGRVLGRKGYHAESLALLLKLIEGAPQVDEAQFSIGYIYSLHHRWELAARYFQTAANLAPQMVKAHYHLGIAMLELKKFEFARQAFDNTLKLSPIHSGALYGLAECDIHDGDFKAAKEKLVQIQSTEPSEKASQRLAELEKRS